MAICDELATQLSGLQSQLAKLQAEQDDPEGTCAALGLTGDDCTLYIKSLGGKIRAVQSEIAVVQQQQRVQGCVGPPVPTLIDALAMIPSADTRLEVFGVSDTLASLWHMYQTIPGGGWTQWFSHGRPPGASGPAHLYGTPALIHSDARIYLFITAFDFSVDRGKLVGISQVQPSGGWTDWVDYGAPPSTPVYAGGSPAVGLSGGLDNLSYLQVFVPGSDGNLYRLSQAVAGQDVWADWISHGQPTPSSQVLGSPVLASSADGRLELFIVAISDGNLYHIWQTTRGGDWSDWFSHGRPPSTTLTGPPAIAASADGRLELFVVGKDGNLYHIWQTTPSGGWSDWFSHGGNPPGLFGPPVLFSNADKRLELFVQGVDPYSHLTLYNLHQTNPSDGWTAVSLFGKPASANDFGGTMALNRNFDGRLELFVWGGSSRSDSAYHIYQKTPNGDWSDWYATY